MSPTSTSSVTIWVRIDTDSSLANAMRHANAYTTANTRITSADGPSEPRMPIPARDTAPPPGRIGPAPDPVPDPAVDLNHHRHPLLARQRLVVPGPGRQVDTGRVA